MLKKAKIEKTMKKIERKYEALPDERKIEKARLAKRYSSLKRRLAND